MARTRTAIGLIALGSLALGSCSDVDVLTPSEEAGLSPIGTAVAASFIEEANDVFFLPPLAEENPNPTGEFNPGLAPSLRVCEIGDLDALLAGQGCVSTEADEIFAAGSAVVQSDRYDFSWDTQRKDTPNFSNYYQLQVLIGTEVVGRLNLDPQKPRGPGQSDAPGLVYAFRVGETIPVKIWLGTEVLCDPDAPEVTECITGAVVDQAGADLALDGDGGNLGAILGLNVPANALPDGTEAITVRLERIAPEFLVDGDGANVECIPLFDAPQFGECFRITSIPDVTLDLDATVSICLDPVAFAFTDGTPLSVGQQQALQMIRFNDGTYEAMRDAEGDCSPAQLAALQAGVQLEDGSVLDFGDEDGIGDDGPSDARPIRLGGLTSSFSRFRFALTGLMVADESELIVQQTNPTPEVSTFVTVEDYRGNPVPDATVRFAGDGTASPAEVTTDANGVAATVWTVDTSTPGTKTLTASALGLAGTDRPNEDGDGNGNNDPIVVESVSIQATVVGPPAQFGPTSTSPSPLPTEAEVGSEVGDLTVVVQDAAGQAVEGATVTWNGDGFVGAECSTDADGNTVTPCTATTSADGSVTVAWTLGTAAGAQAMAATVDGIDGSVSFSVAGAPGAPFAVAVTPGAPVTALIGDAVALTATVTDQFQNLIAGEALTWSVTSGGGAVTPTTTATDAAGVGTSAWTLGLGANTAQVSTTNGLVGTFSAIGECFEGFGTADVNGAEEGDEWACATSQPVTVNLGGGSSPGVLKWMNDDTRMYFLIQVQQGAFDDVNSVRIDFDNTGNGATGDDDVIGYDADSGTSFDGVLTDRCANRSQSSCFASDSDGNQVEGAAANAAGWTTYELSQPLNADGGNGDDIVAPAGFEFGFFFTLSNGNGAKGNTQVPGFRDYSQFRFVTVGR